MRAWLGVMAGLEDHTAWISTFILALLAVSLLRLRRRTATEAKKTKLLPSPPKLPIIGNLHQLGKLQHRSLRDLSLKHGPLMLLKLGQIPTLVASSAKMAEEFMKTHDLNFASRPPMAFAEKMAYGYRDVVFSPYGEYWRHARKICVLELLSTTRVRSFWSVRKEEVENMNRTIASSKGSVVNMSRIFKSLTNDIICRIAFGRKYAGEDGKKSLADLSKETVALFSSFYVVDFFPSLGWIDVLTGLKWREKKYFQRWDDFLESVIQEHIDDRRDEKEHTDFVDVLLHVQKNSALDNPLTNEGIKALIMNIIAAGSSSTLTTLEWALALIVKHPQVMKKVQAEIREVVGRKLQVEENDLYQMDYLRSTIKETLRLYPPGPLLLPHESIRDVEIDGYVIPAKTRVFINAWAIGRDPSSWERAEEFVPERFINSPIDFKGKDFVFIPFGAGRRSCPGISFAITVIELVLANILHQFDWDLPNGENVEDLDMTETPGMSLEMKSDILLLAVPYFV